LCERLALAARVTEVRVTGRTPRFSVSSLVALDFLVILWCPEQELLLQVGKGAVHLRVSRAASGKLTRTR
jgi:hypothetical protein